MTRFRSVLLLAVLIAGYTTISLAQTSNSSGQDPLVQVLVQKGVLTSEEAKSVSGTPAEQRERLVQLLKQKGVLSDSDEQALQGQPAKASVEPARLSPAEPSATKMATVSTAQDKTEAQKAASSKPPAPTFVPAVAPIRVLQTEPAKPGGLIPDVKLGAGASLKIYGFIKASAIHDRSSPYGNDFPLPGFLGVSTGVPGVDTVNGAPEFHVKARSTRFGVNFEWPDISPKVSVTGRIEADFEGNFTRVSNRNISSIRSSQPSIRLAWGRIDYKPTDKTGLFLLAGQDWSPFGSSILPNMIETTGLGIGFGTLYTREPQMRVGISHDFGGDRHFTIDPEFAITLPAFGAPPPFVNTNCPTADRLTVTGVNAAGSAGAGTVCTSAAGTITAPGNLGDQLAFGERLGVDSERPGIEGRVVFQWQADKAKGVQPAQIVLSGMHATRTALVPRSVLATFAPAALSSGFLTAFPSGTSVDTDRWGAAAGISLPTRFVTIVGQYYRGTDLRWFFAGQIYPAFNSTTGLTSTFLVPSIDGETNVAFGLRNGVPTVAPQEPVRSQGGFFELGFPLSRIANAEPASRAAGWTLNLHYGYDASLSKDVRRASPAGGRGISDLGFANLQWKYNQYLTFALEESYYRTRAMRGTVAPFLPIGINGFPANQWHDVRSEFATIFTF